MDFAVGTADLGQHLRLMLTAGGSQVLDNQFPIGISQLLRMRVLVVDGATDLHGPTKIESHPLDEPPIHPQQLFRGAVSGSPIFVSKLTNEGQDRAIHRPMKQPLDLGIQAPEKFRGKAFVLVLKVRE